MHMKKEILGLKKRQTEKKNGKDGLRMKLQYNKDKWQLCEPEYLNTIQFFITNKCNRRCKGCFYASSLDNKTHMTFDKYINILNNYLPQIQKVVLIGGEPTLSPHLSDMIVYNQKHNLTTTIYTNGYKLDCLRNIDLYNVKVRIGILGLKRGEKALIDVDKVKFPVFIVQMLRQDNIHEVMDIASYAEENFNCSDFMLSSIRDIEVTKSFWEDTEETISNEKYAEIVQNFLNEYDGNMNIHISRRGVFEGNKHIYHCRFFNFFPNKTQGIICPLDISLQLYDDPEKYSFQQRKCNKHSECILQKLVLKRRQ